MAFIGLGIMGLPMASNLVKAGFHVTGYNRSMSRVDALVTAGGAAAQSVAQAVEGADLIVTMLPDSPDVRGVVTEDNGLLASATPGALWIDCSTIRPDVAAALADQASDAGVRALDAPVSGGEQGAIDGSLSVMVGGSVDDFNDALALLKAVGKTVVHVGSSGAGQTVKAANQLIVGGTIALVAEALVFLKAHAVDTDAAIEVLGGGLAGSAVLNRKAVSMIEHRFEPGFRVDLHHKDFGIVVDAARSAGVAIPMGAQAAQLMGVLHSTGRGSRDHSALMLLIEELSRPT